MSIETVARVSTDPPTRYGKQLASHLSRRLQASRDEAEGRGQVTFGGEEFSGGLTVELAVDWEREEGTPGTSYTAEAAPTRRKPEQA